MTFQPFYYMVEGMKDWLKSLHAVQVLILELAIGLVAVLLVFGVAVALPDPAASTLIIGLVGMALAAGLFLPFAWLAARR